MAAIVHRGLTGEATAIGGGVHLHDVGRSFGGRVVLDNCNLSVAHGEFVALLGASGSGKSTLLRIVAGLDTEATGTVEVPSAKAIVYQEHRLLPWHKVWRNVALGLPREGRRERALEALAEVGLAERADAWPLTLSGGESQRAAIARALVREPQLLLLDEPFASVDALTRLRVQGLVSRLWEEHRPAVLLVTHDVDEAVRLADRAVVLRDGHIAHTVPIDLPRPRDVDQPGFARIRRQLLAHLGVEPTASAPTASNPTPETPGPADPAAPPRKEHP